MNSKKESPSTAMFATSQAAKDAVALLKPLLEYACSVKEIGESGFLYLVIMDPTLPYGRCSFEEAILYEYAQGDRRRWDADYDRFAKDKARVSWRTGLDSHILRYQQPQRLTESDTGLWGSVCLDGIIVAASGANPWFDEALAMTVAAWFRALVKRQAIAHPETPALKKN